MLIIVTFYWKCYGYFTITNISLLKESYKKNTRYKAFVRPSKVSSSKRNNQILDLSSTNFYLFCGTTLSDLVYVSPWVVLFVIKNKIPSFDMRQVGR